MKILISLLLLIYSVTNAETIIVNKSIYRQQQLIIDIFKVPNASLPSDVPVENEKYWLDLERMGLNQSPH